MRIGDRGQGRPGALRRAGPSPGACRAATASRGFTFLALLAVLALLGASLATLGTAWTTATQREKERELRFRGAQIRQAVGRYVLAQSPPRWPPTLEDLLEDRRGEQVRHHLRRLWTDPFTGRADWVLIDAAAAKDGGAPPTVAGVRSRSNARRLAVADAAGDAEDPRVSDWQFVYAAPAASAAASAPPGGGP